MTFSTTLSPSLSVTGGQDTDLFPIQSELSEVTVAQAAQILDGTEGFVRELLEDGDLDFRRVNGEPLILRDSVLHYAREEERRCAWLAEMVRWDQEMGLYDD